MVKSKKIFALGDYVFAKLKGYRAWPSKVSIIRNFYIEICGLFFFAQILNKKCYYSNCITYWL